MKKLWWIVGTALLFALSCDRVEVPVEPAPSGVPMVEVHLNGDFVDNGTKVTLEKLNGGFKASWDNGNSLYVEYTCGSQTGVSKFIWNGSTNDFVGQLPDLTGDWNYKAYYLGRAYRDADTFSSSDLYTMLCQMFNSTRSFYSTDYDDLYDPLYCHLSVENAGPGVDGNGEGLVFPLVRLTSILLFEFTSGIDEEIESAVLSVTTAAGATGITLDASDINVRDDGSIDAPNGTYGYTVTHEYSECTSEEFSLWFSILPVEFETMTLTVTTKYHVFTTQRKASGSYEAGNIYTVNAAIPDARWTDRYSRASVGDVLVSCDFDEDPYLFYDLGNFDVCSYGASELSQTNLAGGTAPEMVLGYQGGVELTGFPSGKSEIMEVSFKSNDISNLLTNAYNVSPVAGESGLCRGYLIPDTVSSLTADLYIYNNGESDMYVDDIVVRASDHEGFLTTASQNVIIDPSQGAYVFYIAARNYNGTAEIRLSEELVEKGFAMYCENNELTTVSAGVYRVESYPAEVALGGVVPNMGEDIEGTMTFVYEENGVTCSRICNVCEQAVKFTTIANTVNDSYYNIKGKIDAIYDCYYIVNDGTGSKFVYNSDDTYAIGDYITIFDGYVYYSDIYCSRNDVSLYEPAEPLILTPTRLYKEDIDKVSVPLYARIYGQLASNDYVDNYFLLYNPSEEMADVYGSYVVLDGYLASKGSYRSVFVAKEYYTLPTIELLDANGEDMEGPLVCNCTAQTLSFKLRMSCESHNSDKWTFKGVTSDSRVTRSASVINEGNGLYTIYVNVDKNKTASQREGKVTLVFSLGDGTTIPYLVPVYQSADNDAVAIHGDNFSIGWWWNDYEGLGDEILS